MRINFVTDRFLLFELIIVQRTRYGREFQGTIQTQMLQRLYQMWEVSWIVANMLKLLQHQSSCLDILQMYVCYLLYILYWHLIFTKLRHFKKDCIHLVVAVNSIFHPSVDCNVVVVNARCEACVVWSKLLLIAYSLFSFWWFASDDEGLPTSWGYRTRIWWFAS